MWSRLASLAGVGMLLFAGCSAGPHQDLDSSAGSPPTVQGTVVHRDPRLDRPTFVWIPPGSLPRFAGAEEAATETVRHLAATFALDASALAAVTPPEVHGTRGGSIVARVRQRVRGVEVFRAGLSIALTRSFEPVAAAGIVAGSLAGTESPFSLGAEDAARAGYAAVTGRDAPLRRVEDDDGDAGFFAPDLDSPARVRRVFFPLRDHLEPAYRVELLFRDARAWSLVLSAVDGRVLFRNDLVRWDACAYRAYADPVTLLPADGPQGNGFAPHPSGRPDGLRPAAAASDLVTLQNYPFSRNDPWLLPAATRTRGNNVDAYADLAAPDGFHEGDGSAAPTGAATFDHVYDPAQPPAASIPAAVTQLFYVTNFLHDWFYDAGFDEPSGNPQLSNFGRGGRAGDLLRAEAQDYSGRNNANAVTPADGASPRLQMFVFSGPSYAEISVATPPGIAGVKSVGIAGFGDDAFELTGSVVLASDAQGADPADACEPLPNASGTIVLAHRGLCTFVQKAQNAQAAGAAGLVVANVAGSADPDTPPFMGGTSSEIGIPVLSVSLADGQALEAALAEAVTLTMKRTLQTDLDGALDTTIVAHEWGHVLSNRLIADGDGLATNQAAGLGEGFSDFVSLLLMARAEDAAVSSNVGWSGAWAIGPYATSGGGADSYFGLRRVPYSIDFAKDPLTFKHIQNGVALPSGVPISFGEDGAFNAEVHAAGEVWATMLWECYVALLRDPRNTFEAAREKMKRYLVASLKMTPPDPTLLEARDALLAVAYAEDETDFDAFWGAFARRGAGVGAVGPGKDSPDNDGVVESHGLGNDIAIVLAKLDDDVVSCDRDGLLDDAEIGTVEVTIRNTGAAILPAPRARLFTGDGFTLAGGAEAKFDALRPFEIATAKIRTSVTSSHPDAPLLIGVAVSDPTLAPREVMLEIPTRFHSDEVAEASAFDSVETTRTSWTVARRSTYGLSKEWSRTRGDGNAWWTVPDVPDASDHTLASPTLAVDGTRFSLSFRHRWSFRTSTRRGDVDGGVIELSEDAGRTWRDIERYAPSVDYNTTLSLGRGDNVLGQRRAYGNQSAGYPDRWISTRLTLDLPAPSSSVRVRFRMGTGSGFTAAPGWDIDDIAFEEIASLPFFAFVPHRDLCDPNAPTVSAKGPARVASLATARLSGTGSHPSNAPLSFVWSQLGGPRVALASDGAAVTFQAPEVGVTTDLVIALHAHDGALLGPGATVPITVVPRVDRISAGGGCTTSPASRSTFPATSWILGLALLALRGRSRRAA